MNVPKGCVVSQVWAQLSKEDQLCPPRAPCPAALLLVRLAPTPSLPSLRNAHLSHSLSQHLTYQARPYSIRGAQLESHMPSPRSKCLRESARDGSWLGLISSWLADVARARGALGGCSRGEGSVEPPLELVLAGSRAGPTQPAAALCALAYVLRSEVSMGGS
jgi:hypothetical protein